LSFDEPIPLHSMEAEMSCLGACLFGDRAVDEAMAIVEADDFFRPAHQVAFAAVARLRHQGCAVDMVTLKQELIRAGALDNVGGEEFIVRIAELVPNPGSVRTYARVVKENASLRRLQAAMRKGLQLVDDPDLSTAEKLAKAEQFLEGAKFRLAPDPISLADMAKELMQDLDSGIEDGVSTGFKFLDTLTTCGGYPKGQTSVVSAYQKGGKTTFAVSSAIRNLKAGRSVLYYTLADLSPKLLTKRIVTQETGISKKPRDLEEEQSYLNCLDSLYSGGWKLDFLSSRVHGSSIEEIEIAVKGAFYRQPRNLVFVDYAQKIETKNDRLDQVRALEFASKRLVRLAEDLGAPVVVGSQITEDRDGNITTKYARALEEDAGVVYRIHRKSREERDEPRVEVEVAYNRFGEERTIKLSWDKARVMFDD
jgi:replicative DNA helicase